MRELLGVVRAEFDDMDSPSDVVDALLLSAFVSGTQPWSRSARLDRVRAGAALMPEDARLLRSAARDDSLTGHASGDGWTLRAVTWKDAGAEVTVTAVSKQLAEAVLADAIRDAAELAPVDDSVAMGFWYHSPRRGVLRISRTIATARWSDIRGNYASRVAAMLDDLMTRTAETINGRLLLLHGPPVTGKTTALRTLAREWRSWCQLDCVLDPEHLFADPTI